MLCVRCSAGDSYQTEADVPLAVGCPGPNRCAADLCHSSVGESRRHLLESVLRLLLNYLGSCVAQPRTGPRDIWRETGMGTVTGRGSVTREWEWAHEQREKLVLKAPGCRP